MALIRVVVNEGYSGVMVMVRGGVLMVRWVIVVMVVVDVVKVIDGGGNGGEKL